MKSITASELKNLINSGKHVDLIDVRTPVEFRAMHVTVARNVPLDRLDPNTLRTAGGVSSDPLYVVCRSGGRSRQACEKL
jgi:rhodanese-related sulfurtransferase